MDPGPLLYVTGPCYMITIIFLNLGFPKLYYTYTNTFLSEAPLLRNMCTMYV
uniref:Uncharacterized protein n=1 Tax=Lepeophtheirus salmonis TaxID=72036 RepID=A0A0K2TV60_LEPSM